MSKNALSHLQVIIFCFQFAALWVTGVLQEKLNQQTTHRSPLQHARAQLHIYVSTYIFAYIQTNKHTHDIIYVYSRNLHARTFHYIRPPWKGRFVCVRLLWYGERRRICILYTTTWRRHRRLFSRLFWVKLLRCSIWLFVCAATTGLQTNSRQTTLYVIIPSVISAWDMSYVRAALALFIIHNKWNSFLSGHLRRFLLLIYIYVSFFIAIYIYRYMFGSYDHWAILFLHS